MFFNRLLKRSATDKMEDQSQGHLYLCNKPFKWVTSMLYLSYAKVTEENGFDAHIEDRICKAKAVAATLRAEGFCVPDIGPKLAAQLFKTFIRPVLTYGLENIKIEKRQMNNLKRSEGNIIKTLLGILTRCIGSLPITKYN